MAEVLGQPKNEEEIIDILSGHLCRCTGYHGITAAFRELTQGLTQQGNANHEGNMKIPGKDELHGSR